MPHGQHSNGTLPLRSQSGRQTDGSQYHVRPGPSRVPSGPNVLTFNLNTNHNEAPGAGTDEETNTSGSLIIGVREAVRLQTEPEEGWHNSYEELSTDVPSSRLGPSRYPHGTLDTGSATTADAGMVRLPPKDGRVDDAEELDNSSEDDQGLPQQDVRNIGFCDLDKGPLSPHLIVEQACRHAEQSSSILTEEDFQHFMRQPLEARQQNLAIYFRNLSDRSFVFD
ncbi:hypothetical protein N7G274_000635 [Stereocaulon virgatum]|uniref:Uncharacterized protein n=1 Tax=Stereocaulon virgatum TaxID=373712 RepID=A0ABR4APD4_9LECA